MSDPVNSIVINDGLQRLGAVVEVARGRWKASDAKGDDIGTFANQRAATNAVLAARRAEAPAAEGVL